MPQKKTPFTRVLRASGAEAIEETEFIDGLEILYEVSLRPGFGLQRKLIVSAIVPSETLSLIASTVSQLAATLPVQYRHHDPNADIMLVQAGLPNVAEAWAVIVEAVFEVADVGTLRRQVLQAILDAIRFGSGRPDWPSIPNVDQELGIDFKDSVATPHETEWTESRNRRRCELIDKEIAGQLSVEEEAELEHLQTQMLACRRKVAPLPLQDLRELHQELLRRSRSGTELT